jgi:hypothetical protein
MQHGKTKNDLQNTLKVTYKRKKHKMYHMAEEKLESTAEQGDTSL